MPQVKALGLVGTGLLVALASASAQALPLQPLVADERVVHETQFHEPRYYPYPDYDYVPRYRPYPHHPRRARPHLDCRWHYDHEHCRLHFPPPRPRHWGYVYGDPRRPHLDCRRYYDRERCRVHVPPRHHDLYID